METKKGIQLNQAFGAVLTLVLVAVLVIIAIVIFVTLGTSFEGASDVITVSNESGFNMTAGMAVSSAINCSFGDLVVTGVENGTDIWESTNYESNSITGVVVNTTSFDLNTSVNISYTYTWGTEACTASDNMTTEFSNYTSLIGLVGTIIFLGLVIGVLVASFAFGGRKDV